VENVWLNKNRWFTGIQEDNWKILINYSPKLSADKVTSYAFFA
jgi:hypothetical protein